MAKNKKRKIKPKSRGYLTEKLRNDVIGLQYTWQDPLVIQFLTQDETPGEYQIDPRAVRFSHCNPQKALYARKIFNDAMKLLSTYIPFKWVIRINAEFKSESGKGWGSEEEFEALATFDDLTDHVTGFFDEVIKKAEQVSKGELGQLTFKNATFNVCCEDRATMREYKIAKLLRELSDD